MPYSIEIKPSAVKVLKRIPRKDQIQIVQKIKSLSENPRPLHCVRLADSPYYRIRHGDYRIIYDIQENQLIVLVLKIGHRRDVYK